MSLLFYERCRFYVAKANSLWVILKWCRQATTNNTNKKHTTLPIFRLKSGQIYWTISWHLMDNHETFYLQAFNSNLDKAKSIKWLNVNIHTQQHFRTIQQFVYEYYFEYILKTCTMHRIIKISYMRKNSCWEPTACANHHCSTFAHLPNSLLQFSELSISLWNE